MQGGGAKAAVAFRAGQAAHAGSRMQACVRRRGAARASLGSRPCTSMLCLPRQCMRACTHTGRGLEWALFPATHPSLPCPSPPRPVHRGGDQRAAGGQDAEAHAHTGGGRRALCGWVGGAGRAGGRVGGCGRVGEGPGPSGWSRAWRGAGPGCRRRGGRAGWSREGAGPMEGSGVRLGGPAAVAACAMAARRGRRSSGGGGASARAAPEARKVRHPSPAEPR